MVCVAEESRAAWPRRPPLSRALQTENTGGKSLRPQSRQPTRSPALDSAALVSAGRGVASGTAFPDVGGGESPPRRASCVFTSPRLVGLSPLRGWIVRLPARLLSKEGWRSWEFIPLTGGDDAGLPTPPAKHELRPAAAAAATEDHQRGVPATHPAGE